jgi:periplasmic mercuric ion binding protein
MKTLKQISLITLILISSLTYAQKKEIKEVKFKSDVECLTCKGKIEKHIAFCKGVKSVNADVETRTVTIGYNPAKTDEAKLKAELEKTGFGAELITKSCCPGNKDQKKCGDSGTTSKPVDEKKTEKNPIVE